MTTSTFQPPFAGSGEGRPRAMAYRTRGVTHGPITRLMSPGDLGEHLKPFVFLDHFQLSAAAGLGMNPHPHSGIATHTTLLDGRLAYGDSTGQAGSLDAGDVEWMQAGGGVWHWGAPEHGTLRGYQLWLALPPGLELAPAASQYLDAAQVPSDGVARLLLGHYGALRSPIALPVSITYLHVRLKAGERWTYQPAADHDVAWLAVHGGALQVAGELVDRELVLFEGGNGAITVGATDDVDFVIGSAAKHPHPLICGSYSVHTSPTALAQGEATIVALGKTPDVLAVRRRA
ncbi:MAG: hypothetical protein JWM80_838 [Cyanobacteria bacterium RYN_339]|nr:hypothetical protein [Cyanobacteria bacterium RYN_339]